MHALDVLEFPLIRQRLRFHCETPLAEQFAGELQPSFDYQEVWDLLNLTREGHEALSKHSAPALGAVGDPREAVSMAAKGSTLDGSVLYRIGESLRAMRALKAFLDPRGADLPRLSAHAARLPDQKRLEDQLTGAIEPDGNVKDSASAGLESIRNRKKASVGKIQERIQSYISGRSRDLLSDPIYTIRDGRYVLPLKAENRGKIRGIVHDASASGQTIYVEPEDVLQLGNALRELEAAERAEVQRLLAMWSAKVGAVADEIVAGVEAASAVDFVLAKARLGYDMKATLPEKSRKPFSIEVQGGRHPLLDQEQVVPLDIEVGKAQSVLITGPNTGGKTVAIKCVGLFVLMAQSGLMLPAIHVTLSPFSQVWADIGDEQSLQQSLSTFSGHVKNIAEALRRLKDGALVLFDEIGAGTDPAEGAALAKSILVTLAEGGATILASTHYGELKAFAFNQAGFTNAAMEFDTRTLRPTYKLRMGAPGASQALRIAERYGISKEVVEKARENLGDEAQDLASMLERLENAQKQARTAQSEADRRLAELQKAEQRANRKLAEAEEIRRNAHAKANEVIEAALREIRLEAASLFEELKSSPRDPRATERVRQSLRNLDEAGHDLAKAFLPKRKAREPARVHKGALVKIEGLTQTGTVLEEPRDGVVQVQVGILKMSVPIERIEETRTASKEEVKPRRNVGLQKAIAATTEIDLRHLRAEEAERDLERFLDDAVLAGLDSVRIVHGKGEGVLRKVTQSLLRAHSGISSYRDGEPAEGGQGVTIAALA
ncbi:MAG TPA: endonuclease MutS2 [Fimbriimonas sp.]|nr:endonuclease MutS2 [Fimbriimonas sp.]